MVKSPREENLLPLFVRSVSITSVMLPKQSNWQLPSSTDSSVRDGRIKFNAWICHLNLSSWIHHDLPSIYHHGSTIWIQFTANIVHYPSPLSGQQPLRSYTNLVHYPSPLSGQQPLSGYTNLVHYPSSLSGSSL